MGYNVIRDRAVVVRRTAVKATSVQVDCISLIRGGSGMKIAIVDDIKGEAERLSGLVTRYLSTHGLFCDQTDLFASGEAFLEHFEPARYDIIFLDIYMSGMTGMETARRIREQDTNCSLLFVTTSPDFAIDSYDVNATYYLLKPVNEAQVTRALDRCNMDRIERDRYVMVPSQGKNVRLFLHNIAYTEYVSRRIMVYMKDGGTVEVNLSQKEFQQLLLPFDWFCDCMKGVLVNFEDVHKLQSDRFDMKCGATIAISRLKYSDVRERYLDYTFKTLREGQAL